MSNVHVIEPKQTELVTIANKIDTGLVAFEKKKSELEGLRDECKDLKIDGIDDKVSLVKVSTMRKRLKAERVAIEKEGKIMRDPLTQISRKISEKENELIGIIEPTEKDLKSKEDWVDQEKERIEQERIQVRINALVPYGYTIELSYLKSIGDETFAKVVSDAKAMYDRDQAEKAEAKRLADEEAEKVSAERRELEELRQKQAEAQAIIDENNRKIRQEQERQDRESQELLNKKIANREYQVFHMGMRMDFGADVFLFDDVTVSELEIHTLEDSEWNALIEKITPVISDRKAERQRKIDEHIANAKKQAAEDAIRDKEEADRLAREQEAERLAMASDKVKFQRIAIMLKELGIPEMKSRSAKKLAAVVDQQIKDVADFIFTNVGYPKKKEEITNA